MLSQQFAADCIAQTHDTILESSAWQELAAVAAKAFFEDLRRHGLFRCIDTKGLPSYHRVVQQFHIIQRQSKSGAVTFYPAVGS